MLWIKIVKQNSNNLCRVDWKLSNLGRNRNLLSLLKIIYIGNNDAHQLRSLENTGVEAKLEVLFWWEKAVQI